MSLDLSVFGLFLQKFDHTAIVTNMFFYLLLFIIF